MVALNIELCFITLIIFLIHDISNVEDCDDLKNSHKMENHKKNLLQLFTSGSVSFLCLSLNTSICVCQTGLLFFRSLILVFFCWCFVGSLKIIVDRFERQTMCVFVASFPPKQPKIHFKRLVDVLFCNVNLLMTKRTLRAVPTRLCCSCCTSSKADGKNRFTLALIPHLKVGPQVVVRGGGRQER